MKASSNLNRPFSAAACGSPSSECTCWSRYSKGYPIPSVFLYRRVDEDTGQVVFEVIDGKQRLESLLMYAGLMPGRFSAPIQLPKWEKPESVTWQQLRKYKEQSRLEEYQIQTIEVSGSFSDIVELFVRINSTGNALTRQEIRNAHFYRSEFLKAAKKLASRYEYFRSIGYTGGWGHFHIPDTRQPTVPVVRFRLGTAPYLHANPYIARCLASRTVTTAQVKILLYSIPITSPCFSLEGASTAAP
jgi:hypothetical protein